MGIIIIWWHIPVARYFIQLSLFVGWYWWGWRWQGSYRHRHDDDGDEEDTDDKDVDNDGDALSLSASSISFSKMKFHTNGSAILLNECAFILIPFTHMWTESLIAHPDQSVPQFCWAIAHFYSQFLRHRTSFVWVEMVMSRWCSHQGQSFSVRIQLHNCRFPSSTGLDLENLVYDARPVTMRSTSYSSGSKRKWLARWQPWP